MIIALIVAEQAGAQIGTQRLRMRMSLRINKGETALLRLKVCMPVCGGVGGGLCMHACVV